MSGLFRSETMKYVQLVLDEESAREAIRTIGEFQLLHIEDHGDVTRRLYKDNKRRILDCLSWERKLQDFRTVMTRNGVEPPGPEVVPDKQWQPAGDCLEQIQRYFEQLEKQLVEQFNFKTQEIGELNTQLERKFVLLRSRGDLMQTGFDQKSDSKSVEPLSQGLLDEEDGRITNTINGTIPMGNQSLFERMVYRVAKGHNNALCAFERIDSKEPFEDPLTGEPVEKSVFTIVLVGSELPRRIRKICNLFGATIFEVPSSKDEIEQELAEINKNRIDGQNVLKETVKEINKHLTSLAKNSNGGSPLVLWERAIEQEKAICESLQKFYIVESTSSEQKGVGGRIAAKCWVPEASFADLKQALRKSKGPMAMCTPLKAGGRQPPTYFKTNVFTGTFQSIVDTYGIACYKEANPGLFTIITFPFLFGVMYGDIFHGSMITIAALYMLINEQKLCHQRRMGKMNEIFGMAFAGRYLIILMGCFAIYCGTIYNDCASIPLDLYGSKYVNGSSSPFLTKTTDEPYPWGIDPAWYHKGNSLQFINSLKMKFAVTVGVIQMSFGIFLGLMNDCYHGDTLSMIFEFLPRMLFMQCTFGYMIFMIIFKMFVNWEGKEAPNLIQTMIKMFLSPGHYPEVPLYDAKTQVWIQTIFVGIAVICIPLMLFPKALIKKQIWKSKYGHLHQQAHLVEKAEGDLEDGGIAAREPSHAHDDQGHHDHRTVGPNFQLSEELITTGIHTIEFVLGCVSNTASYLRLWALSLAHAELSEVFWNKMIMDYGLLKMPIGFVGIAVWIVATVCVLLCMDVLECFLHALRLHWVEFQNKFYQGEGYKFEPFKLHSDDD